MITPTVLLISNNLGNVLKEISEPAGAVIRVKDFILGDPTISVLELWGAEYQESNALLVHAENRDLLQGICDREKVPVSFVGAITGKTQHKNKQTNSQQQQQTSTYRYTLCCLTIAIAKEVYLVILQLSGC